MKKTKSNTRSVILEIKTTDVRKRERNILGKENKILVF